MKRYIVRNPSEISDAHQFGIVAEAIEECSPLEDHEVVVTCGPHALALMQDLRSRGVAPERLSYFDPVAGRERDFYWADQKLIREVQTTDGQKFLRCGISGFSSTLRWRLPEVVVVAGPYGSGKSLFAQILAQDFARHHSAGVSLTCWEDQADEIRSGLIRYRDTAMREDGDKFRELYLDLFRVTTVPAGQDRKISEHLDRMRYQAKRFGTKFFVLDPWNEFDHEKASKQSETEYVREVMKAIRRLADELQIITLITTHIAAEFIGHDGSIKPFRVAHAFGSSQFANKMDRGFCVARTDKWGPQTHMLVRQDKVKLEDRWGGSGDGRRVIQERMGMKGTFVFEYSSDTNSLYWDRKISESEDVQKIWRG